MRRSRVESRPFGRVGSSCHHPGVQKIPGYEGGLLVEGGAYLDDPLFWPVHLGTCLRGEDARRAAFGADRDAAMELYRLLSAEHEWPVFSVPLRSGHTIHVVYRNIDGDRGVDYLMHHPTWPAVETLAVDDGHFMGPGLAWPGRNCCLLLGSRHRRALPTPRPVSCCSSRHWVTHDFPMTRPLPSRQRSPVLRRSRSQPK